MNTFKLNQMDHSLTVRGVEYDLPHVDSIVVEDPKQVMLTRGANGKNNVGVVFVEGVKDPYVITITTMDLPLTLFNLLLDVWKKEERIDYNGIAADGSTKNAKQAILSTKPQQLTLDNTAEAMNVVLVLRTFIYDEVKK